MKKFSRLLAGCGLLLVAGLPVLWWWGLRTPAVPMPPLTGQYQHGTLDLGGRTRAFGYYLPRRLAEPAPVVLVLHGSFGTGDRMRSDTAWAFDELADQHGFIPVYPDGIGRQWNDCRAVGGGEAKQRDVDDVGFLRAIVNSLQQQHAVDPGRVFAVGISNGGQMAFRLALEAPDLVAGVAAVAASLPTAANFDCHASSRPVPVLVIDGTEDPVNPYDGGEVTLFGPFGRRGAVQSALTTAEYWKDLAGYAGGPFEHRYPDADPADGTVATRMVWSAEGRPEVDLITIHGGGHTFPDPRKSAPRVLGRTSHDLPAAAEIWRFFARQAPAAYGQLSVSTP